MNKIYGILDRLYQFLGFSKDLEFCEKYNIKPNTLSTWKKRNKIPYELLEEISQNENLSLDWLLTGKGEMLLSKTDTDTPNEEYKQLEDTLIEKLTAQVIKEELDNYLSEEEAEIIKKFRKLPDNLKKAHQLELDRDLLDEQSKALRKKRVNTPIDSPTDTNAIA